MGSRSWEPIMLSLVVVLGDVAAAFFLVRWLLGNLLGEVCLLLRVAEGPADGLIGYNAAALSGKTN